METPSADVPNSIEVMPGATPPTPSSSAASLLGTVTLLVNDTQVDVTRLIYMLYLDIEQQINRADTKAQITLSTSAILIGIMVNLGAGVDFERRNGLVATDWLALALYAVFIIAIGMTFWRGIAAAFPRAIRKTSTSTHHPNLYFSAQIISFTSSDYTERFCQQSNDAVKRSVLGQIHSKSMVLEAKLRNVRIGMTCLLIALAAWVLARTTLFIGTLAG
ncbi:MAG: hypothetical protein B9S36_03600 [Verrucomicrobiia bacterium Tous-C2TDCM]|nr:MAG: hypothetical protein B9S36_03600 [Verrucomicrobiae bacterium Tous-C2TDCM]